MVSTFQCTAGYLNALLFLIYVNHSKDSNNNMVHNNIVFFDAIIARRIYLQ